MWIRRTYCVSFKFEIPVPTKLLSVVSQFSVIKWSKTGNLWRWSSLAGVPFHTISCILSWEIYTLTMLYLTLIVYAAAKYATHKCVWLAKFKMGHKNIRKEPVWLKIIRFGTQAKWFESNGNVLKQWSVLPDNSEIGVILTKNNSIFPQTELLLWECLHWEKFLLAVTGFGCALHFVAHL